MSQDTYVALDLEMTGLSAKQDRIIEIGAVLVENDEIREVFSTFVNPRCQLTERIVEITGITQADVNDAPEIREILTPLSEFIGERVLLGHRILFDYSFLKRAFVNAGMTFEKCGIDTLKLARICLPQLPSKRLSDLCAYYGIAQQAHRALEDAKAAHFLYQRLKAEFDMPESFRPQQLVYKVKKEASASKKQKERLLSLMRQHKLTMTTEIESMSKNEVSRLTDQILAKYGR
ncbi:MAG: 3'-5' exonuclease [Lachnospiraceae bacterium]|nr:3'-5' exonuclease [Lachnospiraceae bacterium]